MEIEGRGVCAMSLAGMHGEDPDYFHASVEGPSGCRDESEEGSGVVVTTPIRPRPEWWVSDPPTRTSLMGPFGTGGS